MKTARSAQLFRDAQRHLPGGVNSPVRAFKAVGGYPPFIRRGKGSKIYDVDDNEYIDYVLSWGPLILGHANPGVIRAVIQSARNGTSFGAPTELEVTLAKLVKAAFPSMQLVRMVNSGTEAVMSAVRVARGYTGREKILKFEGCYHGHADQFLVRAGSGAATLGIPDSPGVPPMTARQTITAPYNNLEAVGRIVEHEGNRIACIVIEPVAGNMGVIPPQKGFLQGLRTLTRRHGILLIFDEVITGFRVGKGGAQGLYQITPDLTCLGKILGGGLPVGAYGGRRDILQQVAPLGPIYQAGTLSGNPIAMSAGIQTLMQLNQPGVYDRLEALAAQLEHGLGEEAKRAGIPIRQTRVGSMLGLFFTENPVVDYASAVRSNSARFTHYFHGLLDRGTYIAPSPFEASFLSTAHTSRDVERTIRAARDVFQSMS